ncbi:MAG TPA: N-6 DNA methylase, partial [Treponemataceae bacterium]|nr:N-6 DNA methylase [Treponemataceae bacterium]
MKYEAISWEGALIGPETIDKISDENAVKGQKAGDFGLKGKVRDEILSAWAESKIQWSLFKARRSREDNKDLYGTSRTRQSWVVPFLSLLGYELENSTAKTAAGKTFTISHHDAKKLCPVHITGFTESLDKKREGQRASPHSLVQEYINLTDTLYALVTNGLTLRLLRDSSRLVKLTYLEFNLERIFEEDLFADFAVLFRLLHISRWPESEESASDCLLEVYHLDSLDNGSRIREKLSEAVKNAIIAWADGFLRHQDNEELRKSILDKTLDAKGFYDALLTVVYRILFLLVIEERGLTHPCGADTGKKKIYTEYYSVSGLRHRARLMWSDEGQYCDLWATLKDTFRLFEGEDDAEVLDLKPLAGDLFSKPSFDLLRSLSLDNGSFAEGLNLLDSYEDEKRRTMVRVNYAALNVEEFGSIYEGLLDFNGEIVKESNSFSFHFVSGGDRGKSGSHYTPEELVQPLIAHALDPLLEQCLTEDDAEQKILSLKICDDACGSGHILLNAARRLALELSRIRTKADNPDPVSYRKALREVIERCIYGVDFNPQAVRLCKVALWLESHNPGESLGFLDHHIKCGDSLVGLTSADELMEPIPDAAFAPRDGDDKSYAALLRSRQKSESKIELTMQIMSDWRSSIGDSLKTVIKTLTLISKMPDSTPEQAANKKAQYEAVTMGETWKSLKNLADIRLAPFFLSKNKDTPIATELLYRNFLNGRETMSSHPVAVKAEEVSSSRRFFHWFLEFAEVMQEGGRS